MLISICNDLKRGCYVSLNRRSVDKSSCDPFTRHQLPQNVMEYWLINLESFHNVVAKNDGWSTLIWWGNLPQRSCLEVGRIAAICICGGEQTKTTKWGHWWKQTFWYAFTCYSPLFWTHPCGNKINPRNDTVIRISRTKQTIFSRTNCLLLWFNVGFCNMSPLI